jgi:voltage-gated potassium channel
MPEETIYVTSLREILAGVVLVAISLGIHGFGMILTLHVNSAFKPHLDRTQSFALGVFALILASWMIIVIHLAEVAVWAGFFFFKGALPNYSIAYYFSLNEYTTVGSNYNLPQNWRLLEGMIATAGLLGFAWSTGVLLTLAQNFQDQQMQLLKQRRDNRQPKPKPAAGK